MADDIDQAELLARVAHLYFEKGKDQMAIARQFRISRSSVSRLLSQARRSGVVQIQINHPFPLCDELGEELCHTFSIKEARVLRTHPGTETDNALLVSQLGARYLQSHLNSGDTVAISWGRVLHSTIEQLRPAPLHNVQVVQLVGTLGTQHSEVDGAKLVRQLAEKLNAVSHNLNAPLFVESAETRRVLLQEPSIRAVLDRAQDAKLALVGIGALTQNASSALRAHLINPADLEELRRCGAVGDVCCQYFDVNGLPVQAQINGRVIGIELKALRRIPRVVGIASGTRKAKAILGALRGRHISVIITDDVTASRVIQLNRHHDRVATSSFSPHLQPKTAYN